MNEHTNPYAPPSSDTKSTSTGATSLRRPNYVSETLFALFFFILGFSAFVQPPDATNGGIYFSVIWLSCWLSSLVYQRMRVNRNIRSMRGIAMVIGLTFAIGATCVIDSKLAALAVGVVSAGVGTYLRHAQGRPVGLT